MAARSSIRFHFTANGSCGGTITATLQLQDGPADLGTVEPFLKARRIDRLTTNFIETFETPGHAARPAGRLVRRRFRAARRVVHHQRHRRYATPFRLCRSHHQRRRVRPLSPPIAVTSSAAQLSFRPGPKTWISRERPLTTTNECFDGGVLEIQIGAGAFADILAAGGSFVANGYNNVIAPASADNPLPSRQAWSGDSGGFITSIVNLPRPPPPPPARTSSCDGAVPPTPATPTAPSVGGSTPFRSTTAVATSVAAALGSRSSPPRKSSPQTSPSRFKPPPARPTKSSENST